MANRTVPLPRADEKDRNANGGTPTSANAGGVRRRSRGPARRHGEHRAGLEVERPDLPTSGGRAGPVRQVDGGVREGELVDHLRDDRAELVFVVRLLVEEREQLLDARKPAGG